MGKLSLIIAGFIQIIAGPLLLSAQVPQIDNTHRARIDSYLSAGVENGFAGAILVATKEGILINKGYGLANKEKQIPNSPTTVFDIGSNTKQFTAAAILKLVELNKVKTTDPLSGFFKDLPADKKEITIHQLLTHSAGFRESIGRDFDQISEESFFKTVFSSALLHEPGSTYSYSNIGYSILAKIIELTSGKSYESFLNEYLFQPAGMMQTGYLLPNWNEKSLARGYNRNVMDVGAMVRRYQEDGQVTWHLKGNGGINSTQDDMLKWFIALKSAKILPESLLEKFTTAYIGPQNSAFQYAYGWGIKMSDRNTKRISHNGSNGAFAHTIIWLPAEDVLIIYATNANSPRVERLADTIEKMIFDNDFQPEPIQKNVYFFTMAFTENYQPESSAELLALLKEQYPSDLENPGLLNRLGYILLRENRNNWAIALFKRNAQLFPEEGNVWDSLGDGYAANEQHTDAIASYKRAVALGSEGSARKIEELQQE